MNASQRKLFVIMVEDRPVSQPMSPIGSYARCEQEVIKKVSGFFDIKLEKIFHPRAFEGFKTPTFHGWYYDCMPIDAWDENACLIVRSASKPLAIINKRGIEGLFISAQELEWLNKSFVYCAIERNLVAYYDTAMCVAVVDYRHILMDGKAADMTSNQSGDTSPGVYLPLDKHWQII